MRKTSDQKVSNMLNNINEILMENTQDSDPQTIFKNVYRCPECYTIPLIKIKENENKIFLNCLNGHEIEMLFSQYMSNQFKKKKEKIECAQCGSNNEDIDNLIYCQNCQNFLCSDCCTSHENENHNMIEIKNMDIICSEHKNPYTHFCQDCKQNLCEECIKEHEISHQMILLENIILTDEEFNETKNNIMKENETLLKIQKIFKDTVDTLTRKFNDIMAYKFLCLKYKDNIVNTYQLKNINYQVIKNVNYLKYLTGDIKIEPEMNELDIIYELFNFLDSVEYNENTETSHKKINTDTIVERSEENSESDIILKQKNKKNEMDNNEFFIYNHYVPDKKKEQKKIDENPKPRHFKVTKETMLKNLENNENNTKSIDNLDIVMQKSNSSFPINENGSEKHLDTLDNEQPNIIDNPNTIENSEEKNDPKLKKVKKNTKKRKKKINVSKDNTSPVTSKTTQNIKTTFIYEKPSIKSKESNSNLDENDSTNNIKTRSKKTLEYVENNEIISPPVKDKKKSRKKVIKKKIDKKFITTELNNEENSEEEPQPKIKSKKQIRVTSQQKKISKKKLLSDEEIENEEPKIPLKKQTTHKKKLKKIPLNASTTNAKETQINTRTKTRHLTESKKPKKNIIEDENKSTKNVKMQKSHRMQMASDKKTTAILMENSTNIYIDEK